MNATGIIFMTQQNNQQQPDELKLLEQAIEKDLLDTILVHLEKGDMPLERAQEISKEYLALLPFHDKAQLLKKLGDLSGKYQEVQAVYAKLAGSVEREASSERVEQMSQHIKNGNIEEAIKISKGGSQS